VIARRRDAGAYRAFAEHLADLARPLVLRHFRQAIAIEDKDDLSPVTVADREAEAAMRRAIAERFPDHGILGEEYGPERADAPLVWVLDPIDGTKSFITGKPLFGTLIALADEGRPILGIIDMPALDERFVGHDGGAALFNGAPIRTRAGAKLAGAHLHATSPAMFTGADETRFAALAKRVKHPIFGGDCHNYALLAAGWTDLVVEAQLKPYDYCAPAALIAAAGGIATDWQGAALTLASDGRVVMAADAALHAQALAALA
jgi:inositol-phosphate phosphatase/L-galactose 1-phosphate phosphatase/histidinol-phosphatase